MQRTTKRVYTTEALEAWFAALPENWETRFDADSLFAAREIYRSGVSADIELEGNDAIVNFRFERHHEEYVVISLDPKGFSFRASTKEVAIESRLAAAALYEIEELVADEVMDLPPDPGPQQLESEEEIADPEKANTPPPVSTAEPEPARSVRVMIRLKDRDLTCSGYWINERGGLIPVFGANVPPEAVPKNDAEREQIIRLTSLAMRAGFQFVRNQGSFVMNDPGKMVLFGSKLVKEWERNYEVEFDKYAEPLRTGIQRINIDGKAFERRKRGLKIDWQIRVGGKLVGNGALQQLARRKSGLHVIPQLGAVEITEQQVEGLNLWKITGKQVERTLPKYMLFSLFGQRPVHLSLEGDLERWMGAIRDADLDIENTPDFLREYQRFGVAWLRSITSL
ncbi:MAG: hypothetical protein AAF212_10195, partial [Verrucomicrobiota bacterium]